MDKGWLQLSNMGKAHYFDFSGDEKSGRSFCGKWMTFLGNMAEAEDTPFRPGSDCKGCEDKRKAIAEKSAKK